LEVFALKSLLARLAPLLVLAPALLAPAQSSGAASPPAFQFGRAGGNVVPATITVAANGAVTAQHATVMRHRLTASTLASLKRTEAAVGFATLPPLTLCPHTLPDFAARWVAAPTATGTRRVAVRGTCVPRFNRLYAALAAAVGTT
jgi:hypothetical protein